MLGGAPSLALGLIEGVSDAASAVCKLLGGRLADRLRRLKPATAAGYVVTGVAIPAIGLATAWWHVLALRTAAWCGRGFRNPLRDTLLTRSVDDRTRGRAFGIERAMDQAGAVLAPLAVIMLLRASVPVDRVVLLAIVPGLLAAVVLVALVREIPRAEAPDSATRDEILPPPDVLPGTFRRLLLVLFVFGSGDFAKTLLVLWALGQGTGLEAASFTPAILLYAGFNAVTVIAALAGGRLSDRFGRKRVLLAGYSAGAASACCPVVLEPSMATGALALGLAGILVGIEETVERAWAADLSPDGKRGRAFGYVHAVNGAGDLVASVLVGSLWAWVGPAAAFASAAALMAAGVVLLERMPGAPGRGIVWIAPESDSTQ